jgi:hypothetical protein
MREDFKIGLCFGAAIVMAAGIAAAQVGGGASAPGGLAAASGAGGPPAISSCGTGTPVALGVSNGTFGRIQTGGGSTTTCTLTWANATGVATARLAVPVCVYSAEQATTTLITGAPTTAALVLTYTATTAGIIDYHCDGV